MDDHASIPERRPASFFQPQDFAWLLFVAALIATTDETNYNLTILVVLIGAFQIAEPRLQLFASRRGKIAAVGLQLLLTYLLIEFTHGIDSPYHPLFLIPLISAATIFELSGVILVSVLACLAYGSSFLLFLYWTKQLPAIDDLRLGALRMSIYAIVAFLVYQQAKAKRDEMQRTQLAAERLAESNRHLRHAQASLRRSERLAALGQLTAGLAHELRNPLGTIKASAEMLTKESTLSRPDLTSEMAGYIVSEADRVNGLISNFLDFARPLQIHPALTELRPVIEDVIRQQGELARTRNVAVDTHLAKNLRAFDFDADLMKIALSNVLQNAIQASSAEQTVAISAEAEEDSILLTVSDQGKGIAPQHLENIFNPFFTTKPQGVGLGLAIVSKIVDEHQGRIAVISEPGRGTTFKITLPTGQ